MEDMLRKLVTIALCAPITACSWGEVIGDATVPEESAVVEFRTNPNPDRFVPQGLTDDEFAVVSEAALAWCEASHGAKCPRLSAEGGSQFRAVDEIEGQPEAAGYWYSRPLGSSLIFVKHRADLGQLYRIAMHEFGHHFGCSDVKTGVMAWRVDLIASEITTADLACVRGVARNSQ